MYYNYNTCTHTAGIAYLVYKLSNTTNRHCIYRVCISLICRENPL